MIMNVFPYDFYVNPMGILYSALFILLLSAHISPGLYILYIDTWLLLKSIFPTISVHYIFGIDAVSYNISTSPFINLS